MRAAHNLKYSIQQVLKHNRDGSFATQVDH
jgi:hypothetical protein